MDYGQAGHSGGRGGPARGQDMSEMAVDWPKLYSEWPDMGKASMPIGAIPTATLHAELARRGKPVAPEETVAHIAALEARIADLTAQRDSAVHTLAAMTTARNQAAGERDIARAALANAQDSQKASFKLAEHERMLRDMAEARAMELEAETAELREKLKPSMSSEFDAAEVGPSSRDGRDKGYRKYDPSGSGPGHSLAAAMRLPALSEGPLLYLDAEDGE